MKSILTPFQKEIFEIICQEKYITDNFWLAGGTALSEFYLQHRYSDDLDFFTDNEFALDNLRAKLDKTIKKTSVKLVEFRTVQMSKIFFLNKNQKEKIKTDFNYFPFPKFGRMKNYKELNISSLLDIALSKLDTITTRAHARDFVDFYFIQKYHAFDINSLIQKLEKQACIKIDPLFLAGCFYKAKNVKDYPKMIKEFSKEEMIKYFESLAVGLKDKIIK